MLNRLISNFLLTHGVTRWTNSSSSICRAVYVYSHPIVVFCLLALAICFTNFGEAFINMSPMNSLNALNEVTFNFASKFAEKSLFPQQTKLFFLVWMLLAPVMVLVLAPRIAKAERNGWHKRWNPKSLQWQLSIAFMLVLILIAGVIGLLIPGDPGFCKGCTTHSRFGLFVIYGFGAPTAIALLLAAITDLFKVALGGLSNTDFSGKK
jgi:hypothetical protein